MTAARPTATWGSTGRGKALQPLKVIATDGPGKGPQCRLELGTITIGTDAECDLKLEDETVSRKHASVELHAGEVLVKDLKSRNGTRYLGAKIDTARVPAGASIRVGRTTVSFELDAPTRELSDRRELGELLGHSRAMRRVFAVLEKVAPRDVTVLLLGETGAGKGAVARTVHELSPRANKPFVVFDCAAAHAELTEATLFGHEKGAFTGAHHADEGLVARAAGGTLFLDEVGELPVELQPKLLRLLEEREYRPLGGRGAQKADVRIVAATNRDIDGLVKQKRFRLDLYHRLAVAEVVIPPLRERTEDIAPLAARFAKAIAGLDVTLTPATVAAFQCARWDGNVRELRNAVERVLTFGEATSGRGDDSEQPFIEARDEALGRFERDYLAALLKRHKGNASAAARAAKLARSHFYRLLDRHGLKA